MELINDTNVIETVRNYLNKIENTKGKINKIKIVKDLFQYLNEDCNFNAIADHLIFMKTVKKKTTELINDIINNSSLNTQNEINDVVNVLKTIFYRIKLLFIAKNIKKITNHLGLEKGVKQEIIYFDNSRESFIDYKMRIIDERKKENQETETESKAESKQETKTETKIKNEVEGEFNKETEVKTETKTETKIETETNPETKIDTETTIKSEEKKAEEIDQKNEDNEIISKSVLLNSIEIQNFQKDLNLFISDVTANKKFYSQNGYVHKKIHLKEQIISSKMKDEHFQFLLNIKKQLTTKLKTMKTLLIFQNDLGINLQFSHINSIEEIGLTTDKKIMYFTKQYLSEPQDKVSVYFDCDFHLFNDDQINLL